MVRQVSDLAGMTPPAAGPLRRASPAAGAGERVLGLRTSTLLALFVAALLIPAQVQVGPIRLTPYTLMIILCALPLLARFLQDRSSRIIVLDVVVALYVVWIGLSILANHGLSRIVFVASQTITLYGGYLMGRILVRSEADYRLLFRTILIVLLVLLPFALVELLTGRMLLNDLLAPLMTVNPRASNEMRMGLNRVQSVFEHPILFGLFCSVAIANFWYLHRRSLTWAPLVGLASAMTFFSLSSAPNIAQMMQFVLIAWERLTGWLALRWVVLAGLTLAALTVIQLAVPGGIVGLVIDGFAFNPQTGWGRTEIFEYGSAEVLRNPVFGLGFDDWIRPWYKKESVDNFWLLTAMRYGLPTLILLWLALGLQAACIMARRDLTPGEADCRLGYVFAWVGLFFVLGTVHIWGPLSVFVMAYLGAGAWFHAGGSAAARAAAAADPRDRRARTAPAAPAAAPAPMPPAAASPEPAAPRLSPQASLAEARRRRQALRGEEMP